MTLPHSQEAEEMAISCAIQDPSWVGELNVEWFYDLRLRSVCQVLQSMVDGGKLVNPVSAQLAIRADGKEKEIGMNMVEVADLAASSASFETWAEILNDKLALRNLATLCHTFGVESCQEGANAAQLVEEFERKALAVRVSKAGGCVDIKATLRSVVEDFERAFANQGQLLGIPSGFRDLDEITNGFRGGQMIVIAARPSVGKTSLAMNIVEHVAVDEGIPVGVFSLEMSARELLTRTLCGRSKVSASAAQSGDFRQEDFQRMGVQVVKISGGRMHICDSSDLTIGKIRAVARKLRAESKIEMIVVDYLQLISAGGKFESTTADISAVSKGIKSMAKELNIPVIALAQLNRETEKGERKPKLSDLKGSGSIEQDADIVGLLHREKEDEIDLIIAKNRNGRTGIVPLVFQKEFTTFQPRAREYQG